MTACVRVAPTLNGGRGLKRDSRPVERRERGVAPTLNGGRGLKQDRAGGRVRVRGRAHPQRWARIETRRLRRAARRGAVAPTLNGGRGLKQDVRRVVVGMKLRVAEDYSFGPLMPHSHPLSRLSGWLGAEVGSRARVSMRKTCRSRALATRRLRAAPRRRCGNRPSVP